jgi:hypothetical protein
MNLPLVGLRAPVQQVVDILGNADAYVGGRWNPGIFALRGGTPVVLLAGKTAKMDALAGMVGLGSPPLPDPRDLQPGVDQLVGQLLDCLRRGPSLRDELKGWAEGEARGSWGTSPSWSPREH